MTAIREAALPPLRDFVSRRFAVRSPFWSWLLFERAGGALAYGFARLGFSPSAVTLLGGAGGIAGTAMLGTARDARDAVLAAVLLLLCYTLDCADGQLARATGRTSARGGWLDVTVDAVTVGFLTAALATALAGEGRPALMFLLAGAFGASRAAALFTATRVRSGAGGLRLSGLAGTLRTAYAATTDTPFVYALLCATRLVPGAFEAAIAAVAALTSVRTIVSAQHHFRAVELERVG